VAFSAWTAVRNPINDIRRHLIGSWVLGRLSESV
jgi:hypothetical protein